MAENSKKSPQNPPDLAVGRFRLRSPSMQPGPSYWLLPTRTLVTPRRFDLAVKWRFFKHLRNGGDPDAERVYCWHIERRSGARMAAGLPTDRWKRSVDDYVESARNLKHTMMAYGFVPEEAIPVDTAMELLNGSHRVACALALDIYLVPVTQEDRKASAPAWDYEWFVTNGMSENDLHRLRQDWSSLTA